MKMKRLLSTLLVLLLMLSIVPFGLIASGEEPDDAEEIVDAQVQVDEPEEPEEPDASDEEIDADTADEEIDAVDEDDIIVTDEEDAAEDDEFSVVTMSSVTTINGVSDSAKLIEALENTSGELIINLTANINHTSPINLGRNDQKITINLRGYTLSVNVLGTAILVRDAVSLTVSGPGTLDVYCTGTSSTAYSRGIEVSGVGSFFSVSGGAIVNTTAIGVGTGDYDAIGVYAVSGGTATVTNAYAIGVDGVAAMAAAGGTVNVLENAIASARGTSYGVSAWGGTVNARYVSGTYIGAEARDNGLINISTDVYGTGTDGRGSYGAMVQTGGRIFVTGIISGMTNDMVLDFNSWRTESMSNPSRSNIIIPPPQHGWGFFWDEFTTDNRSIIYKNQGAVDISLIRDFVERLYNLVLGRPSELNGINTWVERLRTGTHTGAMIAYDFYFGPEFLSRNLSDEEYINNLYRTMLNREPEPSGKAIWLARLADGMRREDVLADFIGTSGEFRQRCAEAGIAVGEPNPTPEVKIAAFIARMYNTCLGRGPDVEGFFAWRNRLQSGSWTATAVARDFIFGTEFTSKNVSNAEFITVLYRTMLGRMPEREGLDLWLDRMNRLGWTKERVFNDFAGSREFRDICNAYGVRR